MINKEKRGSGFDAMQPHPTLLTGCCLISETIRSQFILKASNNTITCGKNKLEKYSTMDSIIRGGT